jgi:hypothetical protein
MKKLVAAVAASLGVLSMSACAGSHAGSSPVPAATGQQPAGGGQPTGRHLQSICAPDSYGYCLYQYFQGTGTYHGCADQPGIRYSFKDYYLYYNDTYVSTYSWISNTCDGNDPFWSPSDPATDTGDPNLP